jgi:alpha-dioxygenase
MLAIVAILTMLLGMVHGDRNPIEYCKAMEKFCPADYDKMTCIRDASIRSTMVHDAAIFQSSLQCMNYYLEYRLTVIHDESEIKLHCSHANVNSTQRCLPSVESSSFYKCQQNGELIFHAGSINLFNLSLPSTVCGLLYSAFERDNLLFLSKYEFKTDPARRSCAAASKSFYDGKCTTDDIYEGAAGTYFSRLLKPSKKHRTSLPDPQAIGRILRRSKNTTGTAWFSQLAVAWIQFMTHDWFSHANNNMNEVTHWWDASQVYGSSEQKAKSLRTENGKGCHLKLDSKGELLYDKTGTPVTGFTKNFSPLLHVLHTLFAKEHNSICDKLNPIEPAEVNYFRARRIVAAILAKIHTIEWTPALLSNNTIAKIALRTNWYGADVVLNELFGPATKDTVEKLFGAGGWSFATLAPRVGMSKEFDFHTKFQIPEEFVSAYRMHHLLPDSVKVGQDEFNLKTLTERTAVKLVPSNTTDRFIRAFISTPGHAIRLQNYPSDLYDLKLNDGRTIDLAATDIGRDRSRKLPRYNDAREQLLLPRLSRFEDLTSDESELAALKAVYTDVDQIDFMVGCSVDRKVSGFAFGPVPYAIFLNVASRRLFSNPYFMSKFNATYYSDWGLTHIKNTNSIKDVIGRHFPDIVMNDENGFFL